MERHVRDQYIWRQSAQSSLPTRVAIRSQLPASAGSAAPVPCGLQVESSCERKMHLACET